MGYRNAICWCCEEPRPVDNHHLAPAEYGGDINGKQVPLCKSCHSLAHYEAEYYYTNGKYQNIETTIPEGTRFGDRLRKLIKKIVDTKRLWIDEGEQSNDQRRMSQISWDSPEELALAHEVKLAMGFTSLERALKACVHMVAQGLRNKGKL